MARFQPGHGWPSLHRAPGDLLGRRRAPLRQTATGGYQQYPLSVYAGAYLRGPFGGRPNDGLGLQGTYVAINKTAKAQVAANFKAVGLAPPDEADEWIFEVNYTVALAPGLSIAPVAQYVIHPDTQTGLALPIRRTGFTAPSSSALRLSSISMKCWACPGLFG